MNAPRLRVLAVSAPHWPVRPKGVEVRSFTAGTPFSLQNAVRLAAGQANRGEGVWADSNWRTEQGRRDSVRLLEFMDEAAESFVAMLETKPNLLLIGAMTLGMPGAVKLAHIAREKLGGACLIVLGGKHCTETLSANGIHPACPLKLQMSGAIPTCDSRPLFDLFVAGEGEEVISRLGELVHDAAELKGDLRESVITKFASLKPCRGRWTAAWIEDKHIEVISQSSTPLDIEGIPTAPSLFGLQSAFPVFGDVPTGHAYSDLGLGCRYNCWFCSERSGINGAPRVVRAAERLYQHLVDIWQAGGAGKRGEVAAFIEDSILLRGEPRLIEEFLNLCMKNPLPHLRVGCQMTVNDIHAMRENGLLNQFRFAGIEYVAFGMETINEQVAHKMSKRQRRGTWINANHQALKYLCEAKLRAGVFVLWGLGENRWERVAQLDQLDQWREGEFKGQPCAVGLNWATKHPAMYRSEDLNCPIFLDWGVDPESPLLRFMVEYFGEASERYADTYSLDASEIPHLTELYQRLLPTRPTTV